MEHKLNLKYRLIQMQWTINLIELVRLQVMILRNKKKK